MNKQQLMHEITVYTAQMTKSGDEFAGSCIAEAVMRAVYDYHGGDIVWWIGEAREHQVLSGRFCVTCNYYCYPYWDGGEQDDPYIFRVHAEKRTMFVPCTA